MVGALDTGFGVPYVHSSALLDDSGLASRARDGGECAQEVLYDRYHGDDGRFPGRPGPVFGDVLGVVRVASVPNSPASASRPWSLRASRRQALRAGSKVMRCASFGNLARVALRQEPTLPEHATTPLASCFRSTTSSFSVDCSPILTRYAARDACGSR